MDRMRCLPVEARVGLSRIITPPGRTPMVMLSISMSSLPTGPIWPEGDPCTATRVSKLPVLAFWNVSPPSVEYWKSSVVGKVRMIGSGHVGHGGIGQLGGHSTGGMRCTNQRVMTPLAKTVTSPDGLL